MALRPSSAYLATILGLTLVLIVGICHARKTQKSSRSGLDRKAATVKNLELTDLCLFTEASYTRNLTLTDPATPFQDTPLALEHFPSGGLVKPPAHLQRTHDGRN